jgi:hypothetical protein
MMGASAEPPAVPPKSRQKSNHYRLAHPLLSPFAVADCGPASANGLEEGDSVNKQVSKLEAELDAIELWDSKSSDKTHDEGDQVSSRERQERRREIMQEFQALAKRPAMCRQRRSG